MIQKSVCCVVNMGKYFNLEAYSLKRGMLHIRLCPNLREGFVSEFPKVHLSIAIDFGRSTLYTMHVYMSWRTEAKVTLVHFPQVPSRNAHWCYCADDLVEVF